MRYVSAGIADKGVQSCQKRIAANPPKPVNIGEPLYSEKIINKIINNRKIEDSLTIGIWKKIKDIIMPKSRKNLLFRFL